MLGFVDSKLYRAALNVLEEYAIELGLMAIKLEYIAPKSEMVKELKDQQDMVNKILDGFIRAKINDEKEARDILDGLFELDDESALLSIDFNEPKRRYRLRDKEDLN